jgi:FkbM family methyltransferase
LNDASTPAAAPVVESVVAEPYLGTRLSLTDVASVLAGLSVQRLASDIGPVWVRADDSVFPRRLRKFGTWHPEEGRLFRSLLAPGMTAVDVGAMVGYVSRLMAAAVGPTGRVVAIEPEPRNYALLCANLWEARALNVEPLRLAAHRTGGTATLTLSPTNAGDHRAFVRETAGEQIEVVAARGDDLLRSGTRVDLIKIDAQGMDHAVVEGFAATIARCRPVVAVEFSPSAITEFGDDPVAVLRFYRGLGCAIASLDRGVPWDEEGDDAAFVAAVAANKPKHVNLVLSWPGTPAAGIVRRALDGG